MRYLINNRLDRVGSGMGRAQLALAAASFGLTDGAATAFTAAVPALGGNPHRTYGSRLRDAAALVAVADGTTLRVTLSADQKVRLPVRVADLPTCFLRILAAYEDRRFPWYPGVDPWQSRGR